MLKNCDCPAGVKELVLQCCQLMCMSSMDNILHVMWMNKGKLFYKQYNNESQDNYLHDDNLRMHLSTPKVWGSQGV